MLIFMFIPAVYNTVYMIVREKESRVKETMRIMGMNDFAYWMSWYVYYTIITTIISLLAWSFLCINVIVYTDSLTILILILLYAQALFA